MEFAPLGAEWTYLHSNSGAGLYDCDFAISVDQEVSIEDQVCTLVSIDSLVCHGIFGSLEPEIIYSEGEKTYIYRDSSFHLLFDFGAEVGDTIVVFDAPFKPFFNGFAGEEEYNYFAYVITALDSINRNGLWLKEQQVESIGDWEFWKITELLGAPGSDMLFGNNPKFLSTGAISNIPLCYTDDNYNFPILENNMVCYPMGISEISNKESVTVFPNPTRNAITFKSPALENTIQTLSIYNNIGATVIQQEITNGASINVGNLPSGIYLWQIGENRGKLVIAP